MLQFFEHLNVVSHVVDGSPFWKKINQYASLSIPEVGLYLAYIFSGDAV
jgi:hypothetical protein